MRVVKQSTLYSLLVTLFVVLLSTACSQDPDFELYEGKALRIAVLGEPPEIREEQVRFSEISFKDLTKDLDSYNAVFIMKENLPQAAENKYADVYLNSDTPFFFISATNLIPFTVKDIKYNESWEWNGSNSYTVGILNPQEEDSLKNWGYGLYNDEKTEEHIKEMFSRIFKKVEEVVM